MKLSFILKKVSFIGRRTFPDRLMYNEFIKERK